MNSVELPARIASDNDMQKESCNKNADKELYVTIDDEGLDDLNTSSAVQHKSNIIQEKRSDRSSRAPQHCGNLLLYVIAIGLTVFIIGMFAVHTVQQNEIKKSISSIHNITSSLLYSSLAAIDSHELLLKYEDLMEVIMDRNKVTLQILNNTQVFYNALEYFSTYVSILSNPNQLFNFSCASIYEAYNSSPSGYYWFRAPNGSFMSMYCDMDRTCGGVAGGWTRLVKWSTSDCNVQCPSDFIQHNNSTVRSCGIRLSLFGPVCSTVNFSLPNQMKFSKVCGHIKTQSFGSPDAFDVSTTTIELDSVYVDGISLTHGGRGSRTHIWTVAVSVDGSKCSCSNRTESYPPPSFVGDDYFCFATQNCSIPDSCCHSNSPLWFYKKLPMLTSDPIELRACADEHRAYEDVAIEAVEIYVQ